MIVDNITKIALSEPKLNVYMAKFNIFKNRKIIFPHEETIKENHITDTIIKNSVIVFGVNIETFDEQLMINDEIFILDGHHRFQYIIENSIDDLFEVVFVDINDIKIESYNSELLISDDSFLQKISNEKGFSVSNNSKYFISLNKIKYYSEDISDINENHKQIKLFPNPSEGDIFIVLDILDKEILICFILSSTFLTPLALEKIIQSNV